MITMASVIRRRALSTMHSRAEVRPAAWLLQKHAPGIKVRVVNVVDLTALMMPDSHPHGMDNMSFNALFTEQAPVMFAFHNNRWSLPRAGLHVPRNQHHA